MKNARFIRFAVGLLFFAPISLTAQGYSTIEIGNVQSVRFLAAIVQDQQGVPIEGVAVQELGPGWKGLLASTKTDATGAFAFPPIKNHEIYYFELRKDGFDPLRVRVKVDRKRGKLLKLQMTVAA